MNKYSSKPRSTKSRHAFEIHNFIEKRAPEDPEGFLYYYAFHSKYGKSFRSIIEEKYIEKTNNVLKNLSILYSTLDRNDKVSCLSAVSSEFSWKELLKCGWLITKGEYYYSKERFSNRNLEKNSHHTERCVSDKKMEDFSLVEKWLLKNSSASCTNGRHMKKLIVHNQNGCSTQKFPPPTSIVGDEQSTQFRLSRRR
ncbi:uncharacterized protein MONOS_17385 [Monocercomonoides exilis]|uniref:uncharacterized protein n=1 Tax=Monocercomonoides exilis TaxID=2049356 RepID=UPI00355962A5|nr:hypothetical protein MONOS_17385 [Monocercomonoides exilis]